MGLYGTPAMAAEVGMSAEEYRNEIIGACYLNEDDPIASWKQIFSDLRQVTETLDAMSIERVHMQGEDCDLKVQI